MSEEHSTITNVDEEIPSYLLPPPLAFSGRLISIVSCRNRGLKTDITRPIKRSCDTNRNIRDPTKALVGSQNFKLRDRLQNKNSEPKSLALAPKKIIRAKKFGSGSKKNNQSQKALALAPKEKNQSQKARLWLQKK